MGIRNRTQIRSLCSLACFIGWLIINIRVEAGVATAFERVLDGLVGGAVLLASIFLAVRFFGSEADGGKRPWALWGKW